MRPAFEWWSRGRIGFRAHIADDADNLGAAMRFVETAPSDGDAMPDWAFAGPELPRRY